MAEKNKTLLLLQKIDEIILNSITRQDEIAFRVTKLLVTEIDFQLVSIFFYDKGQKMLKRLARSETGLESNLIPEESDILNISMLETENIMVQAVLEKKVKVTYEWEKLLLGPPNGLISIKCLFVFPLIVRGGVIGSMVIGLKDDEKSLSDYRRDLLGRLAQVIGIALDSAFLYNELTLANERLRELDRLKDEFVSVASHELRTPMTAIKSYLWMALDGQGGALNEKQKRYVDRSYKSVDRLIKLVNDMLNISRIDSGRLTVQVQSVDIVQLIREVLDEVGPRATELGVIIKLDQKDKVPPVLADPDKIKEVVYNLLGNSMKFTTSGGNITIECKQNNNMVDVIVKDSGTGISAEDLSKLFQKFGILPGTYVTNKTASGTGLGLYICKSLLDLHEGKITVTSEGIGKGSTFTFSLRVFTEDEMKKLNEKYKERSAANVSLVHTQIT